MKQITIDGMPPQVATELLLTGRLSNRMRKTAWTARSKFFVSEQSSKPLEAKLDNRLSRASWEQLSKWLFRAIRRRQRVQKQYQKLPPRDPDEHPQITVARAALDMHAGQLDIFTDRLEEHKASRHREKV